MSKKWLFFDKYEYYRTGRDRFFLGTGLLNRFRIFLFEQVLGK